MNRSTLILSALLGTFLAALPSIAADDDKWANIRGSVTYPGAPPKQDPIVPGVDKNVCAKDQAAGLLEEDFIINAKNKGLKNVFVWIRPIAAEKDDKFPKDKIHPDLVKPAKPTVEIDQPCCRFIPHVLGAREGQKISIKNSAPVAHNAKWSSKNNGDINPLLPAGGVFNKPEELVFEPGEIVLQCNIHGWMKASVRVFDHPYFAITDEDGNFEIMNAPVGKFSLYVHHNASGWLGGAAGRKGQPIEIKKGGTDVGVLKW